MAVVLVYISVVSNMMAVIIVVMCLLGMIGYIYRLRGDLHFSSTSITRVNQPRIQQEMVRVEIPFSLKIVKQTDGIFCNMTNLFPCLLQTYWCVNIADLHFSFGLPWLELKQSMLDFNERFLAGASYVTEPIRRFQSSNERAVVLKQPCGFNPSSFGPLPRNKYPVAVIMVRNNDDDDVGDFDELTSVIALLTVIHIEDEVCKMKTCVLFQYLKQASGYISHLKPLYFSGSEESYETFDGLATGCTCIVCQMKPVSMALLPCRHTCICSDCFPKLDKCPLCRSAIVSYFILQNNSY